MANEFSSTNNSGGLLKSVYDASEDSTPVATALKIKRKKMIAKTKAEIEEKKKLEEAKNAY